MLCVYIYSYDLHTFDYDIYKIRFFFFCVLGFVLFLDQVKILGVVDKHMT